MSKAVDHTVLDRDRVMSDENSARRLGEVDQYERLLDLDDSVWMDAMCRIQDKSGSVVPLSLNSSQRIVGQVVNNLRALDIPVRLIILKARQEGISTWGLGYGFARANKRRNHNFLMAAHKKEAATELFKKVDMFQDYMPSDRKLPQRIGSKTEVAFAAP